jgi:predicted metalloprotease
VQALQSVPREGFIRSGRLIPWSRIASWSWGPGRKGAPLDRRLQNLLILNLHLRLGGGGRFGGFGCVHLGIGGTLIVGILSLIFHQNLFSIFSGSGPAPASPSSASQPYEDSRLTQEKPEYEFIKFVLNDVQANWDKTLPQTGVPYRHAKLVLYRVYAGST